MPITQAASPSAIEMYLFFRFLGNALSNHVYRFLKSGSGELMKLQFPASIIPWLTGTQEVPIDVTGINRTDPVGCRVLS